MTEANIQVKSGYISLFRACIDEHYSEATHGLFRMLHVSIPVHQVIFSYRDQHLLTVNEGENKILTGQTVDGNTWEIISPTKANQFFQINV